MQQESVHARTHARAPFARSLKVSVRPSPNTPPRLPRWLSCPTQAARGGRKRHADYAEADGSPSSAAPSRASATAATAATGGDWGGALALSFRWQELIATPRATSAARAKSTSTQIQP